MTKPAEPLTDDRVTPLNPHSDASQATPRSSACLNCQTPLAGPFCSECGQRDIPPYPSVRELAVDAFWELSGWDGRFATTVRALVRHPGQLTREFLEGRRARFISPLRLYLMASLVYFVLAATAPDVRLDDGVLEALPRMLFALLPIFAAIVAIFYRGRKYPEHLYFAIHLHAFVFLAMSVAELAKFTRAPMLVAIIATISLLSIPIYATLAFRTNYGGSFGGTLAKEVGVGAIYAATCAVAFVTMIYWVSRFG